MKPLVLALAALALCSATLTAQIPNPGFESWTGIEPDGWLTNNDIGDTTIFKSTDRHSGSFAARGQVISFFGFPISPSLSTGLDSVGFPVSQRYASLTGWYKFAPSGNDRLFVTAYMMSGDSGAGAGSTILNTAGTFTAFAVPITYITSATPTSAWISVTIISADSLTPFPTVGSTFTVDDFAFSGTVSVDDRDFPLPSGLVLDQNYPNPFNPVTTITFSVPANGSAATTPATSLRVFDLLGRNVATLVDGVLEPGIHRVQFDGSGLASGVYLCRLQSGNLFQVRRMLLIR